MSAPKLVLLKVDDWEALYVNGECVSQNHSLDWPYVIKDYLDIDTHWVQDWFDQENPYGGMFPKSLPEFKDD